MIQADQHNAAFKIGDIIAGFQVALAGPSWSWHESAKARLVSHQPHFYSALSIEQMITSWGVVTAWKVVWNEEKKIQEGRCVRCTFRTCMHWPDAKVSNLIFRTGWWNGGCRRAACYLLELFLRGLCMMRTALAAWGLYKESSRQHSQSHFSMQLTYMNVTELEALRCPLCKDLLLRTTSLIWI